MARGIQPAQRDVEEGGSQGRQKLIELWVHQQYGRQRQAQRGQRERPVRPGQPARQAVQRDDEKGARQEQRMPGQDRHYNGGGRQPGRRDLQGADQAAGDRLLLRLRQRVDGVQRQPVGQHGSRRVGAAMPAQPPRIGARQLVGITHEEPRYVGRLQRRAEIAGESLVSDAIKQELVGVGVLEPEPTKLEQIAREHEARHGQRGPSRARRRRAVPSPTAPGP